jgi:thiosulfate reductase/polysulfide reductase chain A
MDQSVATGGHAFTHFGVAAQEIVEASIGPEARMKQWILCAVNPAHSIPDFRRTREAMRSLEFIVMLDVIPTEGAMWADLILPEASYLERHDDILAVRDHPQPFVALRQPLVSPPEDVRGPYWIVQQLAQRLGHEDCFTHPDVTGYLDARLAPLGLSYTALARKGIHRLDEQQPFLEPGQQFQFKTPSGRIEIYSETLGSAGHDPLPRFEPVEQPSLGSFRLIAGRSPYHSFARTQNQRRLMEKDPENLLWLNDGVARAKGLSDGDWVFLQNFEGVRTGPIRVLATPAIRTDVVYTVHGYGSRSSALRFAHAKGISDNALASRFKADGPTGSTGFRVNFVQLVTREGKEIRGETDLCRKQRMTIPPVPEGVAPVGPDGDPVRGSGDTDGPGGGKPTDPSPDGGFFKSKPEDSC